MFFKNTVQKKNCKRKRRFNSLKEAEHALTLINPKRKPKKPNRAYKCKECSGYHLSSKPA